MSEVVKAKSFVREIWQKGTWKRIVGAQRGMEKLMESKHAIEALNLKLQTQEFFVLML